LRKQLLGQNFYPCYILLHGSIDSVQIVFHGSEEGLQLGVSELSNENLAVYTQLQEWGEALSEKAEKITRILVGVKFL
jgi:hypothetical protein